MKSTWSFFLNLWTKLDSQFFRKTTWLLNKADISNFKNILSRRLPTSILHCYYILSQKPVQKVPVTWPVSPPGSGCWSEVFSTYLQVNSLQGDKKTVSYLLVAKSAGQQLKNILFTPDQGIWGCYGCLKRRISGGLRSKFGNNYHIPFFILPL